MKKLVRRGDVLVQAENTVALGAAVRAAMVVAALASGSAWAATVTQTIAYDYEPGTGRLVKQITEPGDSRLCLVEVTGYNTYGNRSTQTVRNCAGAAANYQGSAPAVNGEAPAPVATEAATITARTTTSTYTYLSDASIRIAVTNTLGHVETSTYAGRSGLVSSAQGPNVLTDAAGTEVYAQWAYDGLGRKTLEKNADGTGTRWAYSYCTAATCAAVSQVAPAYAITATPVKAPIDLNAQTTGGANGSYTKTYYDSLDRPLRVETQGFDGTLIYKDTTYDLRGRAVAVSTPYFANASPTYTRYVHDKLDRPIQVTAPDGGISTTVYDGLNRTATNSLGQATTQTRDARGELARVTDADGKTLSFNHDPAGNLLDSTDAAGNVVKMQYDRRGRKIAMQDPDLGAWTYEYDVVGNLRVQTDARGQVTTQSYDQLSRLVLKQSTGLQARWYYDSTYADGSACTKARGKLCESTGDNSYRRRLTYDNLGRPSTASLPVDGVTHTSSASYSADGRLAAVTYPSGFTLSYGYNTLGYAVTVKDGSGRQYWQATAMDAWLHLSGQTLGNGAATSSSYHPGTGRLTGLVTTAAGVTVQNLGYTHDTQGNLKVRADGSTGVNATYTYDTLNRLRTEDRSGGGLPGAQTLTWTYSEIGNIASRSDVGSYSYNPSGAGSQRPHAVAAVSGSVNGLGNPGYSYDANGNLTRMTATGGSRTADWSSSNKVTRVVSVRDGNTQMMEYVYDPQDERVRETYTKNGAVQRSTLYVNALDGSAPFYEEESTPAGKKKRHYLSAGGQVIGQVVWDGANTLVDTQYWHRDAQGSMETATNAAAAVVERMAYEPFGKRRYTNGVTDTNASLVVQNRRGYTGHEHMDEVGLVNMNGRVYDPALSRFMSADPGVTLPDYLQAYNRYSYTYNNPLSYIDPTGYDAWATESSSGAVSAATTSYYSSYQCSWCGSTQGTSYSSMGFGVTPFASSSATGRTDVGTGGLYGLALNDAESVGFGLRAKLQQWNESFLEADGYKSALGRVAGAYNAALIQILVPDTRAEVAMAMLGPVFKMGKLGQVLNAAEDGANVAASAAKGLEGANFAQKTFSPMFSKGGAFAGKSVDDVAAALRSGAMKSSEVPIDFVVRDGNRLILNTRSAQALEAAGIPRSQWNAVNRTGQEMFENMLSGQLQRNGLTSEGIANVRRSGGF